MREILHREDATADGILARAGPEIRDFVEKIRRDKRAGTRPRPSDALIDRSALLTPSQRVVLLDAVGALVDENLFGRGEMCVQFADLLQKALAYLGVSSRAVLGKATYYSERQKRLFEWDHAWVRVGDEVIDGNVDSLIENPYVPSAVLVAPYWGPIRETPRDRRLREDRGSMLGPDSDVLNIWWPDLRLWLDSEFPK